MKILQLFLYIWIVGISAIFAQLSERIGADRNCDSAEYPYLASLALGGDSMCGGSFVTPRWMLTAARCCSSIEYAPPWELRRFTVLAGQSSWLLDAQESSPVAGVFLHSGYKRYPLTADICLIKLQRSVTPSSKVKISKLATTADYEGFIKNGKCNNALTMGFGDHNHKLSIQVRRRFDPRVKCTNLPVLSRSKCTDDKTYTISNDIFCMKRDTHSDTDVCLSDFGGPVYCQNLQIGVVAAGLGCGNPRRPGIYIRVDQHKDYIGQLIQMQERKLIDGIGAVDKTNSTGNVTNAGTSAPVDTTTKGKSSAIRYTGSFQSFMISAIIINIVTIF